MVEKVIVFCGPGGHHCRFPSVLFKENTVAAAYIVDAVRTAGGRRNGRLSQVSPADLGAGHVELGKRCPVPFPLTRLVFEHNLRFATPSSA